MTVKELRIMAQMTQKEFAEYFGISKRTIESWETESITAGRKCPDYLLNLIEYKLIKEGIVMTYKELKKQGKMIETIDYQNCGIYSHTYELWLLDGKVYIHENHPNLNTYTGETTTYYIGQEEELDSLKITYEFKNPYGG